MADKISIQIHPRAFAAFGEDLVTSDFVAISELVKNSYDAFASCAEVIFGKDKQGNDYIEIRDDGFGMTDEVIRTAWATVATPYKKNNPVVTKLVDGIKKTRVVSGNKGLGRFSAARLGNGIKIITKSGADNCIEADFNWKNLAAAKKLEDCYINISLHADNPFLQNADHTGTIIRITDLKSHWTAERFDALKDDLARLISPFDQTKDFSIKFVSDDDNESIEIEPHRFIKNPIYKIWGTVTKDGTIKWDYHFSYKGRERNNEGSISWAPLEENEELYEQVSMFVKEDIESYQVGPFDFEIRAWDLDADTINDVSKEFSINRSDVRKNIRQFKGLSVYRDGVLVLPKSDASRDWLGLDARRISEIGKRISTSQIVGIINLSAKDNPAIKDTTDREKLAENFEYQQFLQIVAEIIERLQIERYNDRIERQKKGALSDLLSPLSSKALLAKITQAESIGENVATIVGYVKEFSEENEKNLEDLNSRLIYYAQTASLGSVSIVILHEFLTGTTSIDRFLGNSKDYFHVYNELTKKYWTVADNAQKRMTDVARSFAPLYKKNLNSGQRWTNLQEAIDKSISLISAKKSATNVTFESNIPKGLIVCIGDGELQTILINLYDNACYWLNDSQASEKRIVTALKESNDYGRVLVSVSDTGPGIDEEHAETIFLPGVTSKQHGIGMGLVIATELLNNYHGKIGLQIPGDLCGATFVFDLPRGGVDN